MNLILLSETDFIKPGRVRLGGRRFCHIKTVHRAALGDTLSVGVINGKMGIGAITHLAGSSLEMDIHLDKEPPHPLPITLVLALPRPKMLKRILGAVTSLGVKKIYLINAWRVEKSYWSSPVLEEKNLKKALTLGLEQAKDTLMPQLFLKRFFTPFVKEELPEISKSTLALTAHPKGNSSCPKHPGRPVTLTLGPEGGFIDKEIGSFETAGFKTVTLGRRILRLETAVPVLISRLL